MSTSSSPLVSIANIGAVLVHDGEALHPLLLAAGLVDEGNAAIEIALFAGQPLVDGIGDDVREPPPVVRRGEELLADQILAGNHVPKPVSAMMRPSPVGADAAGDQRLRVERRQLLKFGVTLGGTTGSMKADGSAGAKRPERFRSAVMTCATFWLSSSGPPPASDEGTGWRSEQYATVPVG